MASKKPLKLYLRNDLVGEAKNLNGQVGEKCNNCGGFGFTMSIQNKKLNCKDCNGTGVANISMADILKRIVALEQDNARLRQAIIETLQQKGIKIKTNVNEGVANA